MDAQGLGDTVRVESAGGLAAFAICHYGPSSEAEEGFCFIKFGAVRCAVGGQRLWTFARRRPGARGLGRRAERPRQRQPGAAGSHQHLAARGFRTVVEGVNMYKRDEPGYCRPGVHITDDWR
ncbi:MAG: hypothetical protein JO312_05355 [Hyphomicrobiales bacterium]|nr:hypothetical protein [Hyphomicrobiales bacterium]